MVAVQMSGGLGNQMFEYALYLKLKALGKEVKLDDFTCYGEGERRKQLEVFGIRCRQEGGARQEKEDGGETDGESGLLLYDRLTRAEYVALTDSDLRLSQKVRRKLTGRKDLSYREAGSDYDEEIFRRDPALFLGYFQTEKYFKDIEKQVREAYRFRCLPCAGRLAEYEAQIKDSLSVSVHIRRGDYLDPKYKSLYEGICGDAYYREAMERMRKRCPGVRFFLFSNDPDWVKGHYRDADCTVVEGNDEDSGYADLYLMSLCRHHIIANSSFSWWGAWLGENPEKTVIAPKKWLNGRSCRDIYTEEMVLL